MDDVKKRSPGYAESQIRVLLGDLNKADGTHNAKVVAVKRFSDYVSKYRPDVSYHMSSSIYFFGCTVINTVGNGRSTTTMSTSFLKDRMLLTRLLPLPACCIGVVPRPANMMES
jgi:hypothetical protein